MKALRRSQTSTSASSNSNASSPLSSSSSSWVQLRSALFVVASASPSSCSSISTDGGRRSTWSRRKKKNPLSIKQWQSVFTSEGRLRNGGVKFLKKVRSGGVDPSIRAEVWPFLLGVYDLNSTKEERELQRNQQRKEYEKLRRRCKQKLNRRWHGFNVNNESSSSDEIVSARESLSGEETPNNEEITQLCSENEQPPINDDSESSDSDSSDDPEPSTIDIPENFPLSVSTDPVLYDNENFSTWQRIIRVDALRDTSDWLPSTSVTDSRARRAAEAVGLKDYEHLEAYRILHASRLVAILEAYAWHDPEIGYCQGMSDLLSPILTVFNEDHDAFWCFVGFMKRARHNFRLDEVGIRRQLGIVAKIIKYKDAHLYRHLEKMEAEDCFFVYRMVVVLFRRELTYEQTMCLWEVMWADQAAIRAGIGKSAWGRVRVRLRAPPTDDLLLYAIAAAVLQRRKLIIERYSSMDEVLRECNGMCGQLDVWKLLDDAHDLVMNLHDKVETSF